MPSVKTIPLPKKWPEHIKSAVIHTISLATTAFTVTYGWISQKTNKLARILAELDIAKREIALLKEEIRLKDKRFRRLSPRRRPYYSSIQRLQILQLKAARGWSTIQTAKAMMLNEHTVSEWLKRIDEDVCRFQVPMEDSLLVRVMNCESYGANIACSAPGFHRAVTGQGFEVLALNVIHGEIGLPLVHTHIMDGHDVRMLAFGRRLSFSPEATKGLLAGIGP